MTPPLHILLIAPSAPPENSPEAMQVGRFLTALDPDVRVTLVTVPVPGGWARPDESLEIKRPGLRVITLRLPFHRFSHRLLSNRRFSWLHIPDTSFWLPWLESQVLSQLKDKPNVIYSRSYPFSAATLARGLKQRLQIPWLMHLSDPWVGSPYRNQKGKAEQRDLRLEADCFSAADLISLTTEGQAVYYRSRYPYRAEDILVTPNMMPLTISRLSAVSAAEGSKSGGQLRLVYTGAFYGERTPKTLIDALAILRIRDPRLAERIIVDFYGNASDDIVKIIIKDPACNWHGHVPFSTSVQAQIAADILLTIEPGGGHPLLPHFMLCKNLDYIAAGKPVLAITVRDSETAKLCARGFGWSVAPGEAERLADLLQNVLADYVAGIKKMALPDLSGSPWRAEKIAGDVRAILTRLTFDDKYKEEVF